MTTRIGINGFGRIGRQVLRATMERHPDELEVVVVNDLADPKSNAHLFKYDTNFGRYPGTVEATDGAIVVDGQAIKSVSERDPAKLPWGELGVDIVVESTGFFTNGEKAAAHIEAGAKESQTQGINIIEAYAIDHRHRTEIDRRSTIDQDAVIGAEGRGECGESHSIDLVQCEATGVLSITDRLLKWCVVGEKNTPLIDRESEMLNPCVQGRGDQEMKFFPQGSCLDDHTQIPFREQLSIRQDRAHRQPADVTQQVVDSNFLTWDAVEICEVRHR